MRGFIPYSNEDGRVPAWQYLPCGAIKPSIGMALVQSSGNLAIATGTTSSGVARIVAKDGDASGSRVLVKFD